MTRRIVGPLLGWFDARTRDIPWRGETDPYAILVAEVMAQQTRIETVRPYYRRFRDRFPDVHALAAARLEEVLRLWEGLGYYARARNLHAAAGQIVERFDGRVPERVEELRTLPGIGPYTAGAVASLAFGRGEPAIDGNARRVLSRLFDLPEPTASKLDDAARRLLASDPDRPGSVNQAIMDLGSRICLPRNPRCGACPVSAACVGRKRGTVADRPPRRASTQKPERHSMVALVRRNGSLFVVRRPPEGLLGGLWDLPGLEVQGPKIPAGQSLKHRIASDFALSISVGEELPEVRHTFSHFRLRLRVYRAEWRAGVPTTGREWSWASPEQLEVLAFPVYLRRLLTELSATSGTS